MTASEFTFLAIGLALGVASGAALIEVLRSRPPAPREVRVTVAPNAIHARFAATLSDPTASLEAMGPAPGGPGDRRWHEGPPAETPARRIDDTGTTDMPTTGTPVPSRPEPIWLSPTAPGSTTMVPVPMSIEPDPLTAALRSTAAAAAVAAMAGPGSREATTHPMATASADPGATGESDAVVGSAEGGSSGDGGGVGSAAAPTNAPAASAPDTGPCADERRVADERCAVATRARAGAVQAADALRSAQRTHDAHVAAATAGAAAADPRAVRSAKEAAQQRFRDARATASTRDDVEGAARSWLAEINQINNETREASARGDRSRAAAAAVALTLDRLAVEADAARISAEQADEACIAAREAVAACDEARSVEAAVAARAAAPAAAPPAAPSPAPQAPAPPTPETGRIAAATPIPEEEFALGGAMGSRAGQDALILRILRGDRGAMQQAVARLAAPGTDEAKHWQGLLGGLADALIARSIEASAFDFPRDHFFWGPFNQTESRDIAAGLSSLGFRFDGFGGWVDDRIPSQRDLAMAVGYAGQDPMRVRRWPTEAETQGLLSDVRVAADEYVAAAAGGLSLGELVTLLGRRADGLTELWNDWGTVRPILLEGG